MKTPPIRRNVTPSTERRKDQAWLGKVAKVERGESTGRKKRYRRMNVEEPEAPEMDTKKGRSNRKRSVVKRKLVPVLVGMLLLLMGFLLARVF